MKHSPNDLRSSHVHTIGLEFTSVWRRFEGHTPSKEPVLGHELNDCLRGSQYEYINLLVTVMHAKMVKNCIDNQSARSNPLLLLFTSGNFEHLACLTHKARLQITDPPVLLLLIKLESQSFDENNG